MKIVIAPDSFKESLTAAQAARAIQKGIRRVLRNARIILIPMADGGEGTLEALIQNLAGKVFSAKVSGPLRKKIYARWGWIPSSKTAIVEMAQASGLGLVPLGRRNPMVATSLGTGQLLRRALDFGARNILLTLGGVATNDAGAGMAQALGYRLLDSDSRPISDGVLGLTRLAKIDARNIHPALRKAKFTAATDVKNPLCGPKGSARVFGPQKGATPSMIPQIDRALRHFAKIVQRDLGKNVRDIAGAGAAGGAGAGAVAFLNAELKAGFEIVADTVGLQKKMKGADLVITGEGKIDSQTRFGKTPDGVARWAKELKIPVMAFCGILDAEPAELRASGIAAAYPLVGKSAIRNNARRKYVMKHAAELLTQEAERAILEFASKL